MPVRITPRSDTKIRAIKPAAKPQKFFDGGGLFLLVTPSGGKLWRLKYRFGGTEKLLSLGKYPQTFAIDPFWHLAEAISPQEAAALIAGYDPHQLALTVDETDVHPTYPKYYPVIRALWQAVASGMLKAKEEWVQEVRNALAAYDRFDTWKPEAGKDLLEAHWFLMFGLIDEAGIYRHGGLGVMAGPSR